MRVILVIERRHLFPGLSPQGFLPPDTVDLEAIAPHLFFAERAYMETCSHYKQIIPYLILTRGQGDKRRVLAYQRRKVHSERRLGGLWSLGFGGHIEPLDRADLLNDQALIAPAVRLQNTGPIGATAGLVQAAALRELGEETGLDPAGACLVPIGYINSDQESVSSVHFGVVYRVALDAMPDSDEDILARVRAQAEPHRACWLSIEALPGLLGPQQGPEGGTFEDWSSLAISGSGLANV